MSVEFVFIVILVLSVIFHEVAHGYMANLLGDPTAKLQGRLTLNPIPHIDIFGSILLPALMIISGSPVLFGWAKPVPYNPYNLRRGGRFAEALVAFAGPATNFAIALFVALIFKFGFVSQNIAYMAIYMNVFLAILNLIPIPPLDGSKVLPAFLPNALRIQYEDLARRIESFGVFTLIASLLVIVYLLSDFIVKFASALSVLILNI